MPPVSFVVLRNQSFPFFFPERKKQTLGAAIEHTDLSPGSSYTWKAWSGTVGEGTGWVASWIGGEVNHSVSWSEGSAAPTPDLQERPESRAQESRGDHPSLHEQVPMMHWAGATLRVDTLVTLD